MMEPYSEYFQRKLKLAFRNRDVEQARHSVSPPQNLQYTSFIAPPPCRRRSTGTSSLEDSFEETSSSNASTSTESKPITPTQKAEKLLEEINNHLDRAIADDHENNVKYLYEMVPRKWPLNFPVKSPMSTKISPQVTVATTEQHVGDDAACENSGSFNSTTIEPPFVNKFIDLPEFVGTQNAKETNNIDSQSSSVAIEPTFISKFIDLPPFDESQMPDLPGSLDPEIEAYLNSTSGGFKYNSERRRLLQTEENDTALSSDNETFAECQSDGFSDTENYRSAINFNTTTSLNNTSNDTTATNKYNFISTFNENKRDLVNISFDEPMDVDISMAAGDATPTKDPLFESSSFSAQISEISLPCPQYEDYSTDEKKRSQISIIDSSGDGDGDGDTISRVTSSITLNASDIDLDSTPQPNDSADIEQSRHEISLNKSVVLPSQDFEECIKESKITITKSILNDINENDIPTSDADKKIVKLSVENLNKYDGNLNVSVEMNTSFGSAKSSLTNSPTFPLKGGTTKQVNKFPTSPMASPNRETRFLEKSENAEQINATRKKSMQATTQNIKELKENVDATNKRNTFEIPKLTADVAESCVENLTNVAEDKRRTFDLNVNKRRTFDMPKPTVDVAELSAESSVTNMPDINVELVTDKRHTFGIADEDIDAGKRRTFDITSSIPSTEKPEETRRTFNVESNVAANSINITDSESSIVSLSDIKMKEERHSFNVLNIPSNDKLNDTSEPMDLDISSSSTSCESKSPSMENNAIQIGKSLEMEQAIAKFPISPPLPAVQKRLEENMNASSQATIEVLKAPPLPAVQKRSEENMNASSQATIEIGKSPPLPTVQKRLEENMSASSHAIEVLKSPPLPAVQKRIEENLNAFSQETIEVLKSPPLSAVQKRLEDNANIKFENSPPIKQDEEFNTNSIDEFKLPPPVNTLKRPSIHQRKSDPTKNLTFLSAKEQANLKDEKDVFMEKFESTPIEDMIKSADPFARKSIDNASQEAATDDDFQANNLILNPSDFDFLLTKGNSNVSVYRNSLLLKFDPLFGAPVLANQVSQSAKTPTSLIPTIEEDEQQNQENRSYVIIQTRNSIESVPEENVEDGSCKVEDLTAAVATTSSTIKLPSANRETSEREVVVCVGAENQSQPEEVKQHAKMSIDVIKDMSMDNDCNKTFENSSNLQSDEKQNNYRMDEMEKKIKNEVLKTEDIEKKLKDAEQREESFIKRITEKDKTITKMHGVIEAYEKAIAELISEKEQLVQGYEKQLTEVKADRDSNYLHLTSLETTYSDLHIKYEKSKEMTSQLKRNEEVLLAERRQNLENLRLQEQRYEKMKNHAMQQLEIANKKLETLTKDHSVEVTKLKALLKKEEISRASINEQLLQKSRENAELVKICDELINGQGS